MTLIDIPLAMGALAYVCWTAVGILGAKQSRGKIVPALYAQTVAFAVIAASFVGLIYAYNSDNRAFENVMWGLIVLALIFKTVNVRRLKMPEGESG